MECSYVRNVGKRREEREFLIENSCDLTDSEKKVLTKNSVHDKKKKTNFIVYSTIALLSVIIVVAIIIGVMLTDKEKSACVANNNNGYKRFAVSSDSDICSQVGCEIFEKGGNALDAAIATAFCTATTVFHSTGIGGGGFLLYHSKERDVTQWLNFRETAPMNIDHTLYDDKTVQKKYGTASVGVPGFVRGLYEAWKRYGKMPWKKLIEPSIKLNRNGFPLPESTVTALKRIKDFLLFFPVLRTALINPNTKQYYKTGEIYKDLKLAETYERIAEDPEDFYTGNIGKNLVEDFCKAFNIEYSNLTISCPMTVEDLKNYKVEWINFGEGKFGNYKTYFPTPPSSGVMIQFILDVLSKSAITTDALKTEMQYGDFLHKLIESYKWGYAQRPYLGDPFNLLFPDLYDKAINFYQNQTISDDIAKNKITEKTHPPEYYEAIKPEKESTGTSHLTTMDSDGNIVGLTTTINFYFGSFVRSPSTGIILNNEMDDFSTPDDVNIFNIHSSVNNFIRPGRRPMSSMTPIFLRDDDKDRILSVGGSGGSMIPSSIIQAIVNLLIFEMEPDKALYSARVHHQFNPDEVVTDYQIQLSNGLRKILEEKDHVLSTTTRYASVQFVEKRDNKLYGAADPRKGGTVCGF